jgi:hypothetical protein
VPNPSGGRGIYILPWSNARGLCSPTVHDIKLSARIAGLQTVTPTSVRHAAKQIAAEGFAGRSAGLAATTALEVEQKSLMTTNFDLLLCLVQQEGSPGGLTADPALPPSTSLEFQAKRTIASIAPRIWQPPAAIASSLEQLAELLEPVGLREQPCGARIPHLIQSIKSIRPRISRRISHERIGAMGRCGRRARYARGATRLVGPKRSRRSTLRNPGRYRWGGAARGRADRGAGAPPSASGERDFAGRTVAQQDPRDTDAGHGGFRVVGQVTGAGANLGARDSGRGQ